MAGQRLLWLVCMPLALMLLLFNWTSYHSLTAGKSQGAAVTPALRQKLVRQGAAMRAMRKLHEDKPTVAQVLETHARTETPSLAAITATSDLADEADEAEAAATEDKNDGKPAEAEVADGKTEGQVESEDAAADEAAATAGGSSTANVAGAAAAALVYVASSAIGTANAAAATVASIGDVLRAAAGNSACKPERPNWEQRPLNFLVPVDSSTWPAACAASAASSAGAGAIQAPGGAELCTAVSAALVKIAKHRELVVVLAREEDASALSTFLGRAPKQAHSPLMPTDDLGLPLMTSDDRG